MKKLSLFLFLSLLTIPYSVFAEEGGGTPSSDTLNEYLTISSEDYGHAATASYVKGAIDAIVNKLETLNGPQQYNDSHAILATDENGKIRAKSLNETGSGNVVSGVSVTNTGVVNVAKSNVSIPVGSASATNNYASIWLE